MSQNDQTHFKNLAALNVSDHFGTLCIKVLNGLFKLENFLNMAEVNHVKIY